MYPEKTIVLGRATTTLPHADAGVRARVTAVTSEGFTPALSRPLNSVKREKLGFVSYLNNLVFLSLCYLKCMCFCIREMQN